MGHFALKGVFFHIYYYYYYYHSQQATQKKIVGNYEQTPYGVWSTLNCSIRALKKTNKHHFSVFVSVTFFKNL